jgi:hypothetical protein
MRAPIELFQALVALKMQELFADTQELREWWAAMPGDDSAKKQVLHACISDIDGEFWEWMDQLLEDARNAAT